MLNFGQVSQTQPAAAANSCTGRCVCAVSPPETVHHRAFYREMEGFGFKCENVSNALEPQVAQAKPAFRGKMILSRCTMVKPTGTIANGDIDSEKNEHFRRIPVVVQFSKALFTLMSVTDCIQQGRWGSLGRGYLYWRCSSSY